MVEEQFAKAYNDGMDIALCCIDLDSYVMKFAGAYRPIYYVRAGELYEMKGSRHPIGGTGSEPIFTNFVLHLETDDKIYMCSDGYASQFGYLIDKKFSSGRVKDLLLDISDKPFAQQKTDLEKSIHVVETATEQTDDVLVLGFKI